jgi:hypothetical protein
MLIHELQAFALALGQQLDRMLGDGRTRAHGATS